LTLDGNWLNSLCASESAEAAASQSPAAVASAT
jgi:hypothetical protein